MSVDSGVAEVDWEIVRSRSGSPTLMLAGYHAHSGYDPESTADRFAAQVRSRGSNLVVLIGSGLGYVVNALRRTTRVPLLVWEPFPMLYQQVSASGYEASGPASPESGTDRSVPQPPQLVHRSSEFDAALEAISCEAPVPELLVHPGYEHVARFETRYALRALRRRFAPDAQLTLASAVVSRRDFAALPRFAFRPTVAELAGSLRQQTAIIASGGPSLAVGLPGLAKHRAGVVFACPQSLTRLHQASVHTHYVVSADPKNLFKHARVPDDARYDTLLADTFSPSGMVRDRIDRTTHFHLRTRHVHSLAWAAAGLPQVDEPFLTVSETALWLAHFMGARRFILLGVDLRSTDPRYRERFRTRDSRGETVETNSHYFHAARYLSDFCARLSADGCEFFRLGPGLPITGAREIDTPHFEKMLSSLTPYKTPASQFRMDTGRLRAVRKLAHELASEQARRRASGSHITSEGNLSPVDCVPLQPDEWACENKKLHSWLEEPLREPTSTPEGESPTTPA